MLRFAPDQAGPVPSRTEKLRRTVLQLVGWSKPANKAATAFPVQELDVWVPAHALWSLRLFTCVVVLSTLTNKSEFTTCSPKPAQTVLAAGRRHVPLALAFEFLAHAPLWHPICGAGTLSTD